MLWKVVVVEESEALVLIPINFLISSCNVEKGVLHAHLTFYHFIVQ